MTPSDIQLSKQQSLVPSTSPEPLCVSHFCWVCMFKSPHGWNTSITKIEAHQRCVLLSWVSVNQFLWGLASCNGKWGMGETSAVWVHVNVCASVWTHKNSFPLSSTKRHLSDTISQSEKSSPFSVSSPGPQLVPPVWNTWNRGHEGWRWLNEWRQVEFQVERLWVSLHDPGPVAEPPWALFFLSLSWI